jgi:hypothetical protein
MLTIRREQIDAMHRSRRRRLMQGVLHADQGARPLAWKQRQAHEVQGIMTALYDSMERLSPFECLTDDELVQHCRAFLMRRVEA